MSSPCKAMKLRKSYRECVNAIIKSHLYSPAGSRSFSDKAAPTAAMSRYSKLVGHPVIVAIHSLEDECDERGIETKRVDYFTSQPGR